MVRLRKMIKTFRRRRLRDQIITNGEALRRLEVERASRQHYDETLPALDAAIDQRSRRHNKLLEKFKETN